MDNECGQKEAANGDEKVTIYHHFAREVLSKSSFDDLVELEKECVAKERQKEGPVQPGMCNDFCIFQS